MICIRAWAVAITVVVAAHAAGVRGGDATPPPPYELGIYSSAPPPPMDCPASQTCGAACCDGADQSCVYDYDTGADDVCCPAPATASCGRQCIAQPAEFCCVGPSADEDQVCAGDNICISGLDDPYYLNFCCPPDSEIYCNGNCVDDVFLC